MDISYREYGIWRCLLVDIVTSTSPILERDASSAAALLYRHQDT
jgi:hypothetical protein